MKPEVRKNTVEILKLEGCEICAYYIETTVAN